MHQVSEEHQMLRELVKKFVRNELMPLEKNVLDRFASGQQASLSDDENARLFKQCKDLGLWALDVPEEVGGANLPAVALVGVNEELGYTCVPFTFPNKDGEAVVTSYRRPPEDALESPPLMLPWARLADALEALIGAVMLDAGYAAAETVVRRLYKDVEITPQMQAAARDPKTELQEWLQGRKMKLPIYRIVGTLGAAHKQTFDVECEIVELNAIERGIGGSRRAGEQAAAAAMLMPATPTMGNAKF